MKFNVALLQIAPAGTDQERNLTQGALACRQAKELGADLAVFPELWNVGASLPRVDRSLWIGAAVHREGRFVQAFAALARELEMSIAITYLEAHQPLPRNTVSIVDRAGKIALSYSKVFICDFGKEELQKAQLNEQEIGCDVNCSPGESFDVCALDGADGQVTVGAIICADREFPEAATELMLKGAELIVVPNACTWDEIRTAGLKVRASESLVGIAMANYPGTKFGCSQAHSCVTWRGSDPVDTLVAKAGDQEQILLSSFDIDDIRAFRKAESWRTDHRKAWRHPRMG